MLGLGVVALPEVVIANLSFPVDEVVCRPVFVVERIPNSVVAVDGDRVGNAQFANGILYVCPFSLESELWRMHTDHDKTRVLIFCRPGFHVWQLSQAVDARVCPEIYQHDLPAQRFAA